MHQWLFYCNQANHKFRQTSACVRTQQPFLHLICRELLLPCCCSSLLPCHPRARHPLTPQPLAAVCGLSHCLRHACCSRSVAVTACLVHVLLLRCCQLPAPCYAALPLLPRYRWSCTHHYCRGDRLMHCCCHCRLACRICCQLQLHRQLLLLFAITRARCDAAAAAAAAPSLAWICLPWLLVLMPASCLLRKSRQTVCVASRSAQAATYSPELQSVAAPHCCSSRVL
jgi:hypothetical protein